MTFDQRKMPFVDPSSNLMLVEKACGQLASFSCVTNTMRPLMNRNASETTKLVGVLIMRQQTNKSIWQSPRSNMQRSLQVLDNFHLNHKVRLKKPISCVRALCFRSGGDFLLVLPTIVSLPISFQTRGFFCSENRPLFPPFQCSEADRHSCG